MKERFVDIETTDGRMKTFVTHPEQGGPYPAVIIYMDIWGVRDELYDIARRVGTVGYYCMVPDFYYRQGRILNQFHDHEGRMISLHRLDQAREKQVRAPRGKLSGAMVMDDTAALLDFIDGDEPVRPGPLGAIGYCMGGLFVLAAAGHFPARFRASVSLHGTRLISDQADSPHLLAQKFQGELYCGFGELDHLSPPSMAGELEALLKPCAVEFHFEMHTGAEHGYALPDRDIHDRQAAARDWELIFAMFRRQLGTA